MYVIHILHTSGRVVEVYAYHDDLNFWIEFFTASVAVKEFIIMDHHLRRPIKNTLAGNFLVKSDKWVNKFSSVIARATLEIQRDMKPASLR